MKKIFIFCMIALVAMCSLNSCTEDCDHEIVEVDYSKTIQGIWTFESETFEEAIAFYADGKFSAMGSMGEEDYVINGTWTLQQNRLVLTTSEGKTHFSGTISVYAEDVVLMTNDGSKDTRVYHYWVDQPMPTALVGTWTCAEADFAETLTIREDGSLVSTRLDGNDFWEDMEGTFMEEKGSYGIEFNNDYSFGKYEVVSGELLVFINPQTNARRIYRYCKEDLSDKLVGSWLVQTDLTSEIHSYYEDGTTDCVAYYYHLGEQFETYISGTYNLVGDILFDHTTYGNARFSFASRVSYIPNGSLLGDVLYSTYEGDSYESDGVAVRIKQSLGLAGTKYDYRDIYVTNLKGEDKEVSFMGYTINFAKMDGSELDKLLRTLLFHIEFPDANTLHYTYQQNNGKQTFDAPVEVEANKMTIKMSAKMPTLKDVTFYAFQGVDGNQLHLCMDKVAFVNFHTNMQAMLMEATDEQFDITHADAVNAIYNNINNAVETIKVSLVMTK